MSKFEYWLRYKAEDQIPGFILITLLLFIVFGLYPLMLYSNAYECNQYKEMTGRDTRMAGLNCYVQYDKEWYRMGELRVVVK